VTAAGTFLIWQFFVDIEFTDGQGSDYDKYEYRHEMTQILEYA
jgi:hypothetical protein